MFIPQWHFLTLHTLDIKQRPSYHVQIVTFIQNSHSACRRDHRFTIHVAFHSNIPYRLYNKQTQSFGYEDIEGVQK